MEFEEAGGLAEMKRQFREQTERSLGRTKGEWGKKGWVGNGKESPWVVNPSCN